MISAPFERERQFNAIKEDHISICTNNQFIRSFETKLKNQLEIENKISIMKNVLVTEPDQLLISVSCPDEGISSTIVKIKTSEPLSRIYDHFKKRIKKINHKDYQIMMEATDV
jgi:hypothetical protein